MAIVYDTYQREAQPQLSLLSAADPARVLAWREGEAVSVAQFLAHVQAVAEILPTAAAAVNLCEDRYAFLVAFCATAAGFAMVWHIWWLVIAGLVGGIAALIASSWHEHDEFRIPAEEVARIEREARVSLAKL